MEKRDEKNGEERNLWKLLKVCNTNVENGRRVADLPCSTSETATVCLFACLERALARNPTLRRPVDGNKRSDCLEMPILLPSNLPACPHTVDAGICVGEGRFGIVVEFVTGSGLL